MTIVVQTPPAIEPVTIAEVITRCRIDSSNQEFAPSAPTVALADPAAAGNVDNGVHRYRLTFVTADGETDGGEISGAVTVADSSVNGQVALSNIELGASNVTSRKIYRTTAGGSDYLLLATIADNSTTTYTDNIDDSSLGAAAPTTNTTTDPLLNDLIATAREQAELELGRYLITQTLEKYYDSFPEFFQLPPIQTVTSITYLDSDGAEQTLAASNYIVDSKSIPSRITRAQSVTWPSTYDQVNAVKVTFVAGYGDAASDVPQSIRSWMLTRIKHDFDNPNPVKVGTIVSPMPHTFVDGLLDKEKVRYRT